MYDLVAATLRSGPACSGSSSSASCASGDASAFTSATIYAPAARARLTTARMSGLAPDCEMVSISVPARSGAASYTELTDGAAEEVRSPRRVSMR